MAAVQIKYENTIEAKMAGSDTGLKSFVQQVFEMDPWYKKMLETETHEEKEKRLNPVKKTWTDHCQEWNTTIRHLVKSKTCQKVKIKIVTVMVDGELHEKLRMYQDENE
jgi:hypothetical protein